MADGTIFERRGIQTAAIVTDTFKRAGDAMARRNGYPDYHYAAIVHPISSLNDEEIRRRAAQALPEILDILGIADGDTRGVK